jgi:hypothetical protein
MVIGRAVPVLRKSNLPRHLINISTISHSTRISSRNFTSSAIQYGKDSKMSSSPPKHQMYHFPQLIAGTGIAVGNFRKVLHTGLYSQLVTMEVPVNGDIGDEVSP